mmetsp:Transcript_22050/g.63218  ORF Transcript_22050/g.63218 Transcript_22050/m.63218 type:complete len:631 (-) Transcript_22050:39-1931(-)
MVRRTSCIGTPAATAAILLAATCFCAVTPIRCSAFTPIVENQRVQPSPSAPLSSLHASSSATPPQSSFAALDLSPDLLESVRGQDWQMPTPIQQLVIPEIIRMEEKEHDSIWSEAPTGSGKTGAFALPLVQMLLRQKRNRAVKNESLDGRVATLVLVPTRELCVQIGNVFEDVIASLPRGRRNLDVVSIYGGVPLEPQIEALAKRRKSGAGVDIVVATPGRLVDVIKGASASEEGKEPEEAALERRLLDALDATGRVDAAISLQQIQDLDLDRKDDDGRGALGDMLDSVKYLVLDEADRLLGQAFKKEMDSVLQLLPRPSGDDEDDFFEEQKMRTLLFSATFPEQIQPRVETVLKRLSGKDTPPLRLSCSVAGISADDIDGEEMSKTRQKRLAQTTQPQSTLEGPASTIQLRTIRVDKRDRTQLLRNLIETNDDWDRVLVFVSTRYSSEHVSKKLRRAGIKATELHGKLDQDARARRLEQFKQGKSRVLLATDLASRGIDVVGLAAVVNYDLPRSPADFTHRIGRTGRAGNKGTAVTLLTPDSEAHFDLIERKQFNGEMGAEREIIPGFEPDEENWKVQAAATRLSTPGAKHSVQGLAHDQMHGGVKGRKKSKKDKLRESAARKAQQQKR